MKVSIAIAAAISGFIATSASAVHAQDTSGTPDTPVFIATPAPAVHAQDTSATPNTPDVVSVFIATSAPAVHAHDTSGTPNTPEKRAMEAAKKGPEELRRFIQRTRMIYGLYYRDFAGEK